MSDYEVQKMAKVQLERLTLYRIYLLQAVIEV